MFRARQSPCMYNVRGGGSLNVYYRYEKLLNTLRTGRVPKVRSPRASGVRGKMYFPEDGNTRGSSYFRREAWLDQTLGLRLYALRTDASTSADTTSLPVGATPFAVIRAYVENNSLRAIRNPRRGTLVYLFHDNARPHIARDTKAHWDQFGRDAISPLSLQSRPCLQADHHSFSSSKKYLRGKNRRQMKNWRKETANS